MSARPGGARFARFGVFEADLQERTLHRNGLRLKLQNQPFEVLAALLEHPGETVTDGDLSRRVWPDGTFVEFEHSLATAVLKIRRVLGDTAENPRFIETIPRHGYRFIAPVHVVSESRFAAGGKPRALRKLSWALPLVAVAALAIGAVAGGLARVAGPLAAADLVLADPPYGGEGARTVLAALGEPGRLCEGAVVVVEYHAKDELPETIGALARARARRYGETSLSTYQSEAVGMRPEELPTEVRT